MKIDPSKPASATAKPELKSSTSSTQVKSAAKPAVPLPKRPVAAQAPPKLSTLKATPSLSARPTAPVKRTLTSDSNLLKSKTRPPLTKNNLDFKSKMTPSHSNDSMMGSNLNTDAIEILDSNQSCANLFASNDQTSNVLSNYQPKLKSMLTNIHRTSSPIRSPYVDRKSISDSANKTREIDNQNPQNTTIDKPTKEVEEEMKPESEPQTTALVSEPKIEYNAEYFESIELANRDVAYYRALCDFEAKNLSTWISNWSSASVPEDLEGDVRLACGLAKLLIDERCTQFHGLVNQCEQHQNAGQPADSDELPVLCSDLQGFWDMINNQIKDVEKKFSHLDRLKANNFVPIDDLVLKPASKPAKPVKFNVNRNYLKKGQQQGSVENETETTAAPAKKPAVARPNKFAEFRAQMKAQKQQQANTDIIIDIVTTPAKLVITKPSESTAKKSTRRKSRAPILAELNESGEASSNTPHRYNLRSRPSDLIKFDSPLVLSNNLETMPEDEVLHPKITSRKSTAIVVSDFDAENKENEENEDFFAFDKKDIVTWKHNDKLINRLSFLPSYDSPNRPTALLSSNLANLGSGCTPNRNLEVNKRESLLNNSPLLKLAMISGKSKRLSITQNQ